ncbi:hypothetical protein [Methyloglobulus sp.]|uniref:hypothetical protein n=1 Tax=Methyloglobulus sp. TaxID=2518622 RepID=UPI0032B7F9C2
MKHDMFKTTTLSALFLAVVGCSGISWGHPITGSLAANHLALDVWHVRCSTNVDGVPTRFVARVKRNSGTGTVRVAIAKTFTPVVSTALTQSSTGVLSPFTQQPASNGSEHIAVFNHATSAVAPSANTYSGDLHCEKSVGLPGDPAAEVGTLIFGGNLAGTIPGTPIINQ